MNILIINHYAGSPYHGMEHRPYWLGRAWTRMGHRVTIAAGTFSHLRNRNPDAHGRVTEEEVDGIRYVWLPTPAYSGNGLGRVASIASFVGQLARHSATLTRPRPDVVIASSTYPFDTWPSRRIAARAGARFVYEVHDLWPLTPMELGHFSRWHPFIVAAQLAEDFGYRRADAVVSLLPGTLPYMESRGLRPERFVWVPNGRPAADDMPPAVALPDSHRALLESLRRGGAFIVGYAGGHGTSNALDVLLAAARRTMGAPVAYVLLGDGPEKARLRAAARDAGLQAVHFLDRVDARAVPEFLARVDAAYLGWHASPLYRFGISPNKLLDYLSAGVPVIHAVGAFNDPVAESGAGVSVPPDDPQAIADAVATLRAMTPESRRAMGARGPVHVDAHYDYPVLARRFLDFVLSQPPRAARD